MSRWVAALSWLGIAACTGTPAATEGGTSLATTAAAGGAGADGGGGQPGAAAGGQGGVAPLALVDEQLVARYHIDEADAGQGPTELLDAAPDPMPLAITYIPEMLFTQQNGIRGVQFIEEGLDGRASVLVDGTKLQERLTGSIGLTIEIVVDVDALNSSGSRLVHTGFDSEWWLTVGTAERNRVHLIANGNTVGSFVIPLTQLPRVALHLIYDSAAIEPEDRARGYLNAGRLARTGGTLPPLNAVIDIPDGKHFVIGNREIGERTIQGVIYYAAIYAAALSDAQVEQNAALLLANDDTP